MDIALVSKLLAVPKSDPDGKKVAEPEAALCTECADFPALKIDELLTSNNKRFAAAVEPLVKDVDCYDDVFPTVLAILPDPPPKKKT